MQEPLIFSIVLAALLVVALAAVIVLWRAQHKTEAARHRLAERVIMLESQPTHDVTQHGDQLEALERVVGGLAHDLNSALSVVIMNLDVMQQDQMLVAKHERRIENMMKAMQKGTNLTRHLLNFSHRHKPQIEVTCLAEFIPSLTELLQASVGKQVEIETIVADDLWHTELDVSAFEASAIHLAIATVRTAATGARLIVELKNLSPEDADRHNIEAREHVVLSMTCSAIDDAAEHGLGEEVSPFVAAPGLAAVERFAARCGGHLLMERHSPAGCRAALYFPRCHETTEV